MNQTIPIKVFTDVHLKKTCINETWRSWNYSSSSSSSSMIGLDLKHRNTVQWSSFQPNHSNVPTEAHTHFLGALVTPLPPASSSSDAGWRFSFSGFRLGPPKKSPIPFCHVGVGRGHTGFPPAYLLLADQSKHNKQSLTWTLFYWRKHNIECNTDAENIQTDFTSVKTLINGTNVITLKPYLLALHFKTQKQVLKEGCERAYSPGVPDCAPPLCEFMDPDAPSDFRGAEAATARTKTHKINDHIQ